MPQVVSDILGVYVFRRLNARIQFLLLQRKADVAMADSWQSFHPEIREGEATVDAAQRTVKELSGLNVSAIYSADYINQFYDEIRDVLVLAPVLAVNVRPQAPIDLGEDFRDCAWLNREEATTRLPFLGQRQAVRQIAEIMSIGAEESEIYRVPFPAPDDLEHEPAAIDLVPPPDAEQESLADSTFPEHDGEDEIEPAQGDEVYVTAPAAGEDGQDADDFNDAADRDRNADTT